MATASPPKAGTRAERTEGNDALRSRRFDTSNTTFRALLLAALLFSLVVLVVLLTDVARDSLPAWRDRGVVDFLTSNLSRSAKRAGVAQGLQGSLLLCLFVAVFAFPIGIAAAVYLEEYAKPSRFNNFIQVNIRNLAGVPSIVYGLLGLAIFVKLILGGTGNLLAGGLTLAVLVLPIVIITAAEAVRAVPSGIREAAYGVGATRWEVIRYHVLPYAAPGILTGTVLSLARAAGETAPLILVGAATGFFATGGGLGEKLTGPYTALPMIIFTWAKSPLLDFRSLTAAAIVVLMVVILLVNAVAIVLRNRYERKW